MSAATLEHELAEYLDSLGYRVEFRHASSYDFIYCYVFFGETMIGQHVFHARWRRWPRMARWAKKVVRSHQGAMRILGGLS